MNESKYAETITIDTGDGNKVHTMSLKEIGEMLESKDKHVLISVIKIDGKANISYCSFEHPIHIKVDLGHETFWKRLKRLLFGLNSKPH